VNVIEGNLSRRGRTLPTECFVIAGWEGAADTDPASTSPQCQPTTMRKDNNLDGIEHPTPQALCLFHR
jgi:hypothetical protein